MGRRCEKEAAHSVSEARQEWGRGTAAVGRVLATTFLCLVTPLSPLPTCRLPSPAARPARTVTLPPMMPLPFETPRSAVTKCQRVSSALLSSRLPKKTRTGAGLVPWPQGRDELHKSFRIHPAMVWGRIAGERQRPGETGPALQARLSCGNQHPISSSLQALSWATEPELELSQMRECQEWAPMPRQSR